MYFLIKYHCQLNKWVYKRETTLWFGFRFIYLIVFLSLIAHCHYIRGKTQHEWLPASSAITGLCCVGPPGLPQSELSDTPFSVISLSLSSCQRHGNAASLPTSVSLSSIPHSWPMAVSLAHATTTFALLPLHFLQEVLNIQELCSTSLRKRMNLAPRLTNLTYKHTQLSGGNWLIPDNRVNITNKQTKNKSSCDYVTTCLFFPPKLLKQEWKDP